MSHQADDWVVLHLLGYELDAIRGALSVAARILPSGKTKNDCAQALGMLIFAQQRAEGGSAAGRGIPLTGDELDAVLPDISNEEAT
jgi:hypothetical protein